MSHSYSSNRVHVIFSTKDRHKRISEKLQPKLWAYIAGIARNHGFETIKVGGAQDHVHALLVLPPVLPLAKAIQLLKGSSSKWLNDTGSHRPRFRMARRLRSLQRQRIADWGCRGIHQEPAGPSCEAQLRGRVFGVSQEIRRQV